MMPHRWVMKTPGAPMQREAMALAAPAQGAVLGRWPVAACATPIWLFLRRRPDQPAVAYHIHQNSADTNLGVGYLKG